jgi:hypothetical protein
VTGNLPVRVAFFRVPYGAEKRAAQIRNVSAQVEMNKPSRQMVDSNQ